MNFKRYSALMMILTALMFPPAGQAQTATPTAGATSLDIQKENLDIERLKLENEKLKMELELAQKQPTPQPAATPQPQPTKESAKDAIVDFKQDFSNKAMALAKAHAGEPDLMVLDFVNAEIWYEGVRYSLYEIPAMAEDQKLKMNKTLDERTAIGTPRWRYQVANAGLFKYESRDRGIFEITAPQAAGDFKVLTPDGISFDTSMADIRNSGENLYFKYDSAGESGSFRILRYNHDNGLNFSDKLEFWTARDGALKKIRFGTLDEK